MEGVKEIVIRSMYVLIYNPNANWLQDSMRRKYCRNGRGVTCMSNKNDSSKNLEGLNVAAMPV